MNAYQAYSQTAPPPQSEIQHQHHHLLNSSSSINNTNINNGSNLSSSNVPLKRTRAKRSCDFCRKRKSRCDADSTSPCSNCRAWGYTCEFQTVRKKRGPPSVYVDNLEKKCKKMESLLTALTKCSIKDLELNDYQFAGHARPVSPPPIQTDSSSSEEDDSSDFDATHQLHNNTVSKDYDSIRYTGQSSVGLRLFDEDVFKMQSSILWPGKDNIELKLMSKDELMIVRTEKSSITGRSDMLLDVGLSMYTPVHIDNITLSSNLTNTTTPSKSSKKPAKHQLDKMIGIYFSHLHLLLPIVNKTKFLDQYHNSTNGPPSILMQAVLALTFRFAGRNLPDVVKDATEFADTYFKKVLKRLRHSIRSRLCHVQAALLLTLYLDMDEGDVESIQWRTLGNAIRMAQDLGLHRSCAKWNLPRSEIETRHRVFYVCYVMDRWLGARAGKPLTILDRDFDADLPSPYEIVDDDSNTATEPNEQMFPIYRSFIHLIKLSEILGRILKSLYAPKAKLANANAGLDDPTILTVFDRRLQAWKNSLDEPLFGTFLSNLDKVNLNLYYYTTVLLLRRPFNNLSTKDYPELKPIVDESEKACIDAAYHLSDLVRKHESQIDNPVYYCSLCVPSCFVYALFQSSLVYLSCALKTRDNKDIQALHQSIDLIKTNIIGPTPRAVEILNMLATINNLYTTDSGFNYETSTHVSSESTYISTKTASPSTSSSSVHSNYNEHKVHHIFDLDEEVPRAEYFQHRTINTSIIGGIIPGIQQTDINKTHSYTQKRQAQQQRRTQFENNALQHNAKRQRNHQRQHFGINSFFQNYPVYNNNGSSSHHRSFSMDQLNSSQQNMYSQQHNRSISHDNLNSMTSPPINLRIVNNSPSSTPTTASMNVNSMLPNCYPPEINNNSQQQQQQQQHTVLQSFIATSLPQTPQAYTAAYNPNMNVSNEIMHPSSLNWSDWDVYIGHHNNSQQTRSSASPQNMHFS